MFWPAFNIFSPSIAIVILYPDLKLFIGIISFLILSIIKTLAGQSLLPMF